MLVLGRVDGMLEGSTPGADHCHQMLLLALLQRSSMQQEEERKSYPFLIFKASFFSFFFSFLSYQMSFAYVQRCTFVWGTRLLE